MSLAGKAPHIIRLAFFCGLHTDSAVDDHAGGRAIILSFICQLLCQFDFEETLQASGIIEDSVENWEVEELCRLFESLVSLLPEHVVVFCLVDGILYYEWEEFIEDMGEVLVTIIRISDDQSTKAALKVLVTSPTKTVDVRKPFPDDFIISMDSLALPGMVSSWKRLGKIIKEGLEESSEDLK